MSDAERVRKARRALLNCQTRAQKHLVTGDAVLAREAQQKGIKTALKHLDTKD